jgi:hypothetical protein
MTMPNFLVIGAVKSATTSVYHYLKQHPEIYMSPTKETSFFAIEGDDLDFNGPGFQQTYLYKCGIRDLDTYQAEFAGVTNEKAIGEASPIYLYFTPKAPQRIRHYLDRPKLIAILRHPAERAFSHFLNNIRDRREPLTDFAAALQDEKRRLQENWGPAWHYQEIGFYSRYLREYFQRFEREQIRVYLFEDLKANPIATMQDIFRFLKVDDTFIPDFSGKYNQSYTRKSELLHDMIFTSNPLKAAVKTLVPAGVTRKLATRINKQNRAKPKLSPQIRQQLVDLYREDILQLQDLLQRDLSAWLS